MTATTSPEPAAHPLATISVRGTHTAEVAPELATVHITVTAQDRHRSDALRTLAERSAATQSAITHFGAAVEDVGSGSVQLVPHAREGRRERFDSYRACLRLTVVITDFTVLGDLLLRVADADGVTITGPGWSLRRDSPAYQQARVAAVGQARQRAEDYAAAAGGRLTGLLEISDTGMSRPDPTYGAMLRGKVAAAAAPGSVADEVTLDLEPVTQHVHATVEARFTLSQPHFD